MWHFRHLKFAVAILIQAAKQASNEAKFFFKIKKFQWIWKMDVLTGVMLHARNSFSRKGCLMHEGLVPIDSTRFRLSFKCFWEIVRTFHEPFSADITRYQRSGNDEAREENDEKERKGERKVTFSCAAPNSKLEQSVYVSVREGDRQISNIEARTYTGTQLVIT